MGSLGPVLDEGGKAWRVFVTGFGQFLDIDVNPSFLITNSLPSIHCVPGLPPINIYTYPHPVEVCYKSVQTLIPKLLRRESGSAEAAPRTASNAQETDSLGERIWKDGSTCNIILNIGLAPGRSHYSIETCAHRDGYVKNDVRNETPEANTFGGVEFQGPATLKPSFDLPDVWRRWKQALQQPEEDVRPSNNAGRYLCEYIFYASMQELWRRNPTGERRCMFLHVPNGSGDANVKKGSKIVLALIAALVASEVTKHARQSRKEDDDDLQMNSVSEGDGCY